MTLFSLNWTDFVALFSVIEIVLFQKIESLVSFTPVDVCFSRCGIYMNLNQILSNKIETFAKKRHIVL